MEFITIEKTTFLSAQQMNDIYNNFQYLKETLENAGFGVAELKDNSVDININPIDILTKFKAVEYNIQVIHTALKYIFDADEKYYKDFEWKAWTINRRLEVWRWIDWLNNAKEISTYYEVLQDKNGEAITDKDGQLILVRTAKESM